MNNSLSPEAFPYREIPSYLPSVSKEAESSTHPFSLEEKNGESFLASLKAYGLQGEGRRILEYLENHSSRSLMRYVERYGVENSAGMLVFYPGTDEERIMNDVDFDMALKKSTEKAISFFRLSYEDKIGPTIEEWAEREKWKGIISESGVNYMDRKYLSRASLESMWVDYDMVFPTTLANILAKEYNLSAYYFSQWFGAIAYLESMCKSDRKVLDHIYRDPLEIPESLKEAMPDWLESGNMAGNIILAIDYLNKVEEPHLDFSLRNEAFSLLSKYSVDPFRIGFPRPSLKGMFK